MPLGKSIRMKMVKTTMCVPDDYFGHFFFGGGGGGGGGGGWFDAYAPVNSYGHVRMISSPNHTFFSLGKLD